MVRPAVTAPITSATNLNQLNELIAASQLDLDRESIELLNQGKCSRFGFYGYRVGNDLNRSIFLAFG